MVSVHAVRQLGPTTPASPTTDGISPLSLATTGTPQAIASISMRPNCSRQPGVVWLGAQERHRAQPRRHLVVRHAVGDVHAAGVLDGKSLQGTLQRSAADEERAPRRRRAPQRVEQQRDSLVRHEAAQESDDPVGRAPAEPLERLAPDGGVGTKPGEIHAGRNHA